MYSYILATQEVDIGGLRFKASLGKSYPDPCSETSQSVHTCNPNYLEGGGRRVTVRGQPGLKYKTLSEK
jgi:hypothetical protein